MTSGVLVDSEGPFPEQPPRHASTNSRTGLAQALCSGSVLQLAANIYDSIHTNAGTARPVGNIGFIFVTPSRRYPMLCRRVRFHSCGLAVRVMRRKAYADAIVRRNIQLQAVGGSRLFVRLISWVLAFTLAAPVLTVADAPRNSAASATTSACTLVMGGGGTVTANAQAARWFAINRTVTTAVIATLRSEGYAVESLIVDVRDSDQRLKALAHELQHDRCTQVVQIIHALNFDPASFSFSARVIHPVTNWSAAGARPGLAFVGDYEQQYSYPLTAQTTDRASLLDLGATIAKDIHAAKMLKSRTP